MALKAFYAKQEEVPAEVASYYVEKDGKWVLDVEGGIKTPGDVAAVQEALRKERADHKKTKGDLDKWAALGENPEEVQTKIDSIAELEAAATGDVKAQVEAQVAAKLKTSEVKTQRELDALKKQVNDLGTENTGLKTAEKTRKIRDALGTASSELKVIDSAKEDVLMYASNFDVDEAGKVVTKEGEGVLPGLDPQVWLTEMGVKRPHWFPMSEGGGAPGGQRNKGGGYPNNPWTAKSWNMTEQSKVYQELGADRAAQMAKAAGTTIGGPKPKA